MIAFKNLKEILAITLEWERNLTYLCKFKATLTPAEMRNDLTFVPAPDNNPYREHSVRW